MKHLPILLILLMIIFVSLFQTGCSKAEAVKQSYSAPEVKVGQRTTCPVMNSQFTVKEDSLYVELEGKKYYVCCAGCEEPLKKDPDKYLKK